MDVLRNAPGFLGTQATLLTDINLVVQILFYFLLCLGVIAQRKKKYHLHDRFQIPVVVLNLFFIGLIMIPSARFVIREIPARLQETYYLIPTVHIILGTLSEGLAIYCLLAGRKILPRKIGVLRYYMWATFVLWTAAVLFGIGIYIIWYGAPYGPPSAAAIVGEHNEETIVVEPGDTSPPATEAVEEAAPVEQEEEAATPTVEVAAPPPAEPERPDLVGRLNFGDGNAPSDTVSLSLINLPDPPADGLYHAWLARRGDEVAPLDLGELPLAGGSVEYSFTDPDGRNLPALYDGVFITVEPANDSDPNPADPILFQGEIAPQVIEHIRHVLYSFPATPDGVGFGLGALEQGALVFDQAGQQQLSIDRQDGDELRQRGEEVINILEGENGPNFGDHDASGETNNSGDGFGLLGVEGYITQAMAHAKLAAEAEGATEVVRLYAANVEVAGNNAIELYTQIRDSELAIRTLNPNEGEVNNTVNTLVVQAKQALDGQDADGDGQIEPIPGEGTLKVMYAMAQSMAQIAIYPTGAEPGEVAPQPADQPAADEPTATPAAADQPAADEPTATAAPAGEPAAEPTPTPELVTPPDGTEHNETE